VSFGDDRSETTAAKVATHLRNETERARSIAAFGNFYERVVRRCRENARRRIVVEISRTLIAELHHRQRARVGVWIANGKNVVDLVGADERIDFRHLRFQLVAVSLDQTTRDDQSFSFPVCF